MDAYKRTSPGRNRAPGHTYTIEDNRIQAHHPVQNEWAKQNVLNYSERQAPAVLLPTKSGMSHANISAAQAERRRVGGYSTDIRHEFNTGYREMIDAGVPKDVAQKAMRAAYKYFDSIEAF